MSRASCEPGAWKYHSSACAFAAAARPARPAGMERSFDPLMLFFPDLDPQSLLQLGAERHARSLVEVPPQLQRFPRPAHHDPRALHVDAHAARIELVARALLTVNHFDHELAALKRNALVIGGVARLQHESPAQQQHL